MALSHYTRNETNGLIFFLDAANPRSYRGESVSNYVNYTNALPTYGNDWGTYNTNQYCGNNGCGNFWTIPSISSVSGNVVTTSSAHPFRTYDVVRPQTSGGGLTANTDYYVKKISDTQFTIHTYNGTQNGTLGFRAIDPVIRDDRVSVNSSSFPTSWWGAPHLPNSGLIKTIVPNGFSFQGRTHDCLRMNFFRTDNVTDGMAYGYTPTVSPGNATYTLSCYMRASDSRGVGKSINWQSYSSSNTTTWISNNFTMTSEWQLCSMTGVPWPASSGGTVLYLYWFSNSGSDFSVDVSEIQIEQNSFASRFAPGARGQSTQSGGNYALANLDYDGYFYSGGWSDVSSTNLDGEQTASKPRWDPQYGGVIKFSGSQGFTFPRDATGPGGSSAFDCQEQTVIVWIKTNALSQNGFWFEKGTVNTQYSLFQEGGQIQWRHYFTDGVLNTQSTTTSSYLNTSNFFQVAGTYNKQQKITYINGSAVTTTNETRAVNYNSSGVTVGMFNSGGYYYNGDIAIVQVYNRALSASEILDNYNKYKSRFGL